MIDRFMLLLVPASTRGVHLVRSGRADSEPLSPRFDITRFEVR